MLNVVPTPTLEESLEILRYKSLEGPLSLQEIMVILSGKGTDVLLLFLSLPFCQPIQIPGMSVPFGIIIALIGLRMSVKHGFLLPKFILNKPISSRVINTIITKSLWLLRKIKRWVHPRFIWMSQHPVMKVFNGVIIFLLGVFLALPIPVPLSNLPAAWSVFLISLGMLEDDGVLISIGYAIAALGVLGIVFIWYSFMGHGT